MSNFLAIATVTATLRSLLDTAVGADVDGASATNLRPVQSETTLPNPGVNIFLYQVAPNAALANADLPTRKSSGDLVQRPRAALDLYYLLSFYGNAGNLEPQRVLGSVVRTLHSQPLLSRQLIRSTIDSLDNDPLAPLRGSNLADELERIRFTPLALSLEELSKLWSLFVNTEYTLSMTYQATVVFIEPEEAGVRALPVQERNIFVIPSLRGVISPDALPGLQLWLQSEQGVTYDNQGVSQWLDRSGNDRHAIQSTAAARPEFVAHGVGTRPVLRFDGVDDYLAIQNFSYASSGAIGEITVCALVRSQSQTPQIVVSFDRDEYWRLAFNDAADAGTNVGWDTRATAGPIDDLQSTQPLTDGNWHLVCGWFHAGATPDKQIFADGEKIEETTAHGGNPLGSGATRFGFIGVGSKADGFDGTRGPTFFLQGDVAEILIYHHALSDAERRQLEDYFIDRYRN